VFWPGGPTMACGVPVKRYESRAAEHDRRSALRAHRGPVAGSSMRERPRRGRKGNGPRLGPQTYACPRDQEDRRRSGRARREEHVDTEEPSGLFSFDRRRQNDRPFGWAWSPPIGVDGRCWPIPRPSTGPNKWPVTDCRSPPGFTALSPAPGAQAPDFHSTLDDPGRRR